MAPKMEYTNITDIFAMFLNIITDELYITTFTTDYDRFLDLEPMFRLAVANFKGCKIPISYITEIGYGPDVPENYGKLDTPITDDEALVIVAYMEVIYLRRQILEMTKGMDIILDSGIKRQSVSQNLKTLTATQQLAVKRAQTLNQQYTKDLKINDMENWY